ncbi:MAG: hypothetical protein ACTSP4_03350 [Candidatus Hodarchaeales archaeon]
MGVNQLDILKGRVTQLKEYFDKTILIFDTRVEEMEKASSDIAEHNKKLDDESSDNSRLISDLNGRLKELQNSVAELEKKKQELDNERESLEAEDNRNIEEINSLKQKMAMLTKKDNGLKNEVSVLERDMKGITSDLERLLPKFRRKEEEILNQREELIKDKSKLLASFKAIRLLVQKKYLSTPELKVLEMIATQKGTMTTDILIASTGLQKDAVLNIITSLRKRYIL